MFLRKLEALERRLVKMIAKDDKSKARFGSAYQHIKAALDSANEGNHEEALQSVSKFNVIMNEFKLLNNV